MSIADNLHRVRDAIDAACAAAGRDPSEVRLLPVSKTFGAEAVAEAYRAGVRLVGENKVQEAAAKAAALVHLTDLRWAMIGHLQTNKAKDVAAFADEFHALDSMRLAETLDRRLHRLDRTMDVFCEVNTSGEATKHGVAPDEVADLALAVAGLPRLRLRGLMTIAARSEDEDRVGDCFATLAGLRDRLVTVPRLAGCRELSMGMSNDFELAIAHGATTVRIGTAIFGRRPPRPAG